jgi:glycosyltransferase involved in cell wall biosynthesis
LIRDLAGNADVRLEPLRYDPIEVYARRMASAHCVVHPSKGEGFGMTPFQAIACETPVIAPAASGMADYLTADNATLLRTAGFIRAKSWDETPGWYFAIDEEHLEECLRNVRSDWPNKLVQLHAVAPAFRRRYAPRNVLQPLADLIHRLHRGAAFDDALAMLKQAESL